MMNKKVYKTGYIKLIDNTELEISPLKLKYLVDFMDIFESSRNAKNEIELMDYLIDCTRICMKQYYPKLKTIQDIEDNIDINTVYDILYFAADIKMGHRQENKDIEEVLPQNNYDSSKSSWEQLDLIKLESEVFMIGAWKNYNELEESLSLPELLKILESKRDLDYQEKKFSAAMQGVDLDEQQPQQEDPWEAMKARVAAKTSGVGSGNPNDITSFQGVRAAQAGFGIGMGLDYATDI